MFNKGSALLEFFRRPVILWNRVFRTFYAKEHNAFLFRTNEVVIAKPSPDGGFTYEISKPLAGSSRANEFSLLEFLQWHNPVEFNKHQVSGAQCIGRSG